MSTRCVAIHLKSIHLQCVQDYVAKHLILYIYRHVLMFQHKRMHHIYLEVAMIQIPLKSEVKTQVTWFDSILTPVADLRTWDYHWWLLLKVRIYSFSYDLVISYSINKAYSVRSLLNSKHYEIKKINNDTTIVSLSDEANHIDRFPDRAPYIHKHCAVSIPSRLQRNFVMTLKFLQKGTLTSQKTGPEFGAEYNVHKLVGREGKNIGFYTRFFFIALNYLKDLDGLLRPPGWWLTLSVWWCTSALIFVELTSSPVVNTFRNSAVGQLASITI